MSILNLTAVALGKKIKAGEITAVEATKAALAQIKTLEPVLNCYVTVDEEGALKRAEEVQRQIEDGTLTGPLAGVPVAIKDNMCTEGLLTTCSSKILDNFKPTYTAEAVRNLEAAGAIILGKTNMDEFAMGSTTETSAYGETKNPWNPEHVPGGSSGGSCAAVAANECFFALGSFVLSSGYYDAYYLQALRTKALIKKAFDKAFEKYDVILGPAAPATAPKLGESLSDPLQMYLGDIYTISVNLAGLPGMTIPCGKDSKGLPIGLQLIGDCFKEKNIIRAGYAYECSRTYEAPELAKQAEKEAQ